MLLAIDIGNSNITCGTFEDSKLTKEWRIVTEKNQTEDWFLTSIKNNAETNIDEVVIGSVVPELDSIFTNLSQKLFQKTPLFVSTKCKTNITNLSEKETQLGADRLADCVAAIEKYSSNRIVVDVGTATKFEVISNKNDYIGGAISPGVDISFDALLQRASKLHDLTLSKPKKVVGGFNTKEHVDSGYVFGFASLIDGMIERIKEEMTWENPTVVLTGGFTDLISPHLLTSVTIDKTLTLEGLRILWEMNQLSLRETK